ncbi:hypothetical protein [Leeuwenhoekiella marinoflava]
MTFNDITVGFIKGYRKHLDIQLLSLKVKRNFLKYQTYLFQ